jgi:hypothetical protein
LGPRKNPSLRPPPAGSQLKERHGPVAQLDRALPSEGKGHTFESCRVRHKGISALFALTGIVGVTKVSPMKLAVQSHLYAHLKDRARRNAVERAG